MCAVLLLVCASPQLVAVWPGTEAERSGGRVCNYGAAACASWPDSRGAAGPFAEGRTRKRSPLEAAPVGGLPPSPLAVSLVEHHGPKAAGAAGLVSTHSAVVSHGVERVLAPQVHHGPSAPPLVPVLHVLSSAKITKTSLAAGGSAHQHEVTVVTGVLHHVVVPVLSHHESIFRAHLGGQGEGLDFGGHGGGHGFFV